MLAATLSFNEWLATVFSKHFSSAYWEQHSDSAAMEKHDMFDRQPPDRKNLQQARDEFRGMLERKAKEGQWQKFFSENPYVLSMTLPLRLAPQHIVPMGRPGRSEPDFVFFTNGYGPLPTYGVIELKRPDSDIITVTRANVAILTRDAETAVRQAIDYSRPNHEWLVKARQDSILVLGSRAHLFVIMGMSTELSRKLGLELYRETIEEHLPRGLQIIPYDTLLNSFEAQLPPSLHILVPSIPSDSHSAKENNDEVDFAIPAILKGQIQQLSRRHLIDSTTSAILKDAIQRLPTGYRIVFVMHDIEGLTHNEIAKMLDSSTGAIKSQLQKARVRLGEILEIGNGG